MMTEKTAIGLFVTSPCLNCGKSFITCSSGQLSNVEASSRRYAIIVTKTAKTTAHLMRVQRSSSK